MSRLPTLPRRWKRRSAHNPYYDDGDEGTVAARGLASWTEPRHRPERERQARLLLPRGLLV
jgi:hypothetical protein